MCNSWSQGYKFKPHLGYKKKEEKEGEEEEEEGGGRGKSDIFLKVWESIPIQSSLMFHYFFPCNVTTKNLVCVLSKSWYVQKKPFHFCIIIIFFMRYTNYEYFHTLNSLATHKNPMRGNIHYNTILKMRKLRLYEVKSSYVQSHRASKGWCSVVPPLFQAVSLHIGKKRSKNA